MSSRKKSSPDSIVREIKRKTRRYFVRENYTRFNEDARKMEKLGRSELDVEYKDYKFFVVEVEIHD